MDAENGPNKERYANCACGIIRVIRGKMGHPVFRKNLRKIFPVIMTKEGL